MKTHKKLWIAVAIVIATLTLAAGTFAWEVVSQEAKNEKQENLNPGARLHDDFNGSNKDIYVENFTDDTDGTAVYARIRLDEYLEIGAEAGKPAGTPGKTAKSVVETSKMEDVSTWYTHNPYDTEEVFHNYINWEEGGSTTYMPTFNKNKDSLKADINGTYAGKDKDPEQGKAYDDYVDYTDPENETVTADEVYDNDGNNIDEGDDAVEGTNIVTKEDVEHTVDTTLDAEVMMMSDWKAQGSQKGPYWVYDTDGWAYWADAIEPGTATGCLLNGISRSGNLGDDYYYAINVVAQFVTASEWGTNDDGTCYFTEGQEATSDALKLLAVASGEPKKIKITAARDKTVVDRGAELQFYAKVMQGEYTMDGEKVEWSVLDATGTTSINESGMLKVGKDESSKTILVKAQSTSDEELYGIYILYVNVPDTYGVQAYPKEDVDYVVQGRNRVFTAEVTKNGIKDNSQNVEWSITKAVDAEGTDVQTQSGTIIGTMNGELQVDEKETAKRLTITATSTEDGTAMDSYEIRVISELEYIPYVEVGSTETVHIDGLDWYILAKSNGKYLLWIKGVYQNLHTGMEDLRLKAPIHYAYNEFFANMSGDSRLIDIQTKFFDQSLKNI